MELALPATLHKLSEVSQRTGISRSALYREIINQRKADTGEIKINDKVNWFNPNYIRTENLSDLLNQMYLSKWTQGEQGVFKLFVFLKDNILHRTCLIFVIGVSEISVILIIVKFSCIF